MLTSRRIRSGFIFLPFLIGITSACGDPPKTLRVAIPYWEETINPLKTDNLSSRQIASCIYESLLQIDDEGNVVSALARRWGWDSTQTILTLTLRADVKFHDGTHFNAHTAMKSLNLAAEYPENADRPPYSSIPYIIDQETSVQASDDTTLVINLRTPHESILYTLATSVLTPMQGKDLIKVSGKYFYPGTGPFKLAHFDLDKGRIILNRFEQYWDTPPQSQRIRFIAIENSADALRLLRERKADISLAISVSQISEVNSDESTVLVTGPPVDYQVLGMNNQRPPFNIPAARMALALCIDRDRLVEEYYRGAAESVTGFVLEGLLPEVESPHAPDYDPEAARELILSSIPPQYRTIEMIFPPIYAPGKQHWLFENLEQILSPLGLQLEPKYTTDFDEYISLVNRREWDISLDGMVVDNRDLFEFLYMLYGHSSQAGGLGLFGMESEELSNTLEIARSSTDPNKMVSYYSQVLEIIAREVPCVPLWSRAQFLIISSEVEEFELGMNFSRIFSIAKKKEWQ